MSSAIAAIMLSDHHSCAILEVNRAFCSLTGHSREDLVGRTALDLGLMASEAPYEETALVVDQWLEAVHRTQMRRKDGVVRMVEFSHELLPGNELVLSVARDVTDADSAAALRAASMAPFSDADGIYALGADELQDRDEWAGMGSRAHEPPPVETLIKRAIDRRLQVDAARFFELASDMVCTISSDGWFELLNDRWEQILGWSKDELRSKPVQEFVHPDDDARTGEHLQGLGFERGRATVRFVNRVATKQGAWRWLEWASSRASDEEMIYAAARDVTTRVEGEEAMRTAKAEAAAARDEALAASRLKSAFLANMSHEVRTPLNGVIGMADLLLDSHLDEQQRDNARLLKSAGETLAALVDDILDFSKIEAGALRLEHVDFDLLEMVEDTCDLIADRAQHKGIELTMLLAPELPSIVRGDIIRVGQVLTNLLSNAVKFTSEGEVRVELSTESASDDVTVVRFEVTDTGIGVDSERLEQLWQPFIQADDSTTRRFGGSGLGLAIVKQLVEMMDGEVGADSVPGRGSHFWFALPLERGEQAHRDDHALPTLAGTRLLVVDDNETNRRLMEQLARQWSMQVDSVAGAEAAMVLLRDNAEQAPFQCVALDMNMPETNGIELAEMIRRDPTIPTPGLVMLTSTFGQRQEAREAGIDVCMTKPVRRNRLRNALAEALGIRSQHAQLPVQSCRDMRCSPLILVAEDNDVNQSVVVQLLERRGYRVEVAQNGVRALEALGRRDFAAVLMDCQMPELSGYDATRELRRREQGDRHIPVIAMTAHALRGDRDKCLASGMDDYVTKPLRSDELDRILRRWAPRTSTGSPGEPTPENPSDTQPTAADEPLDRTGIESLRASLGSAEIFQQIVELFGSQTPELLARIRGAIDDGEPGPVAESAHKLKGSCITLAATQMADVCHDLQVAAAAGSLEGAPALIAQLDQAFERSYAALMEELKSS